MVSINFNGHDRIFSQGQPIAKMMYRNALLWRANPLAGYYGIGQGQVPIHYDLKDVAARTLGLDGSAATVAGLKNKGGTGAYHSLLAGSAATAPRFDQDAMLFRAGDVINMANEASLNGIHLIVALRLTVPAADPETQAIAGHSGGSAGAPAEVQYIRQGGSLRFYCRNMATNKGNYQAGTPVGAWAIIEMRYNWASGDGTLRTRFNRGTPSAVLNFPLGGDLRVNRLGGGLLKAHIGGLISVIQNGGTISAPEPAVVAAVDYLAAQYGVALA